MMLSNQQRAHALGMVEAEVDQSAVARTFGVHPLTITRLVHQNCEMGTLNDHPHTEGHALLRYVRIGQYV